MNANILFCYKTFDNNTGPIGDTVNGIAGPFLTAISILLLYRTLKEQAEE